MSSEERSPEPELLSDAEELNGRATQDDFELYADEGRSQLQRDDSEGDGEVGIVDELDPFWLAADEGIRAQERGEEEQEVEIEQVGEEENEDAEPRVNDIDKSGQDEISGSAEALINAEEGRAGPEEEEEEEEEIEELEDDDDEEDEDYVEELSPKGKAPPAIVIPKVTKVAEPVLPSPSKKRPIDDVEEDTNGHPQINGNGAIFDKTATSTDVSETPTKKAKV